MNKEERIELANLLFPNITKTRDYYEEMYPERGLEDGAMVTRYGPSPTGSVHLGNLYSAYCDMIYARQSNGIFFLKIPLKLPIKKNSDLGVVKVYRGKELVGEIKITNTEDINKASYLQMLKRIVNNLL